MYKLKYHSQGKTFREDTEKQYSSVEAAKEEMFQDFCALRELLYERFGIRLVTIQEGNPEAKRMMECKTCAMAVADNLSIKVSAPGGCIYEWGIIEEPSSGEKKEYNVPFTCYGGIIVKARSPEEAYAKARKKLQNGEYDAFFENLSENGEQAFDIDTPEFAE